MLNLNARFFTIAIISSGLLLTGCTTTPSSVDVQDPAIKNCLSLKDQITQNDNNDSKLGSSSSNLGYSPTAAAKLYKEYAQAHCPQLIENNQEDPLPADFSKAGLAGM